MQEGSAESQNRMPAKGEVSALEHPEVSRPAVLIHWLRVPPIAPCPLLAAPSSPCPRPPLGRWMAPATTQGLSPWRTSQTLSTNPNVPEASSPSPDTQHTVTQPGAECS